MDNEKNNNQPEKLDAPKKNSNKKKVFSTTLFIIGLLTLIVGVTFLLINILATPKVLDAEYLVQTGEWQLEDEPTVIWQFTEVGKGVLTTNAHTNDYNFIWAIDGNKIKIETDWLYKLNNEYTYELNQSNNQLVLTNNDDTFIFVPVQTN